MADFYKIICITISQNNKVRKCLKVIRTLKPVDENLKEKPKNPK